MFPRESMADEDEKVFLGKPYMLVSILLCFLIGGQLKLDYDKDMAL